MASNNKTTVLRANYERAVPVKITSKSDSDKSTLYKSADGGYSACFSGKASKTFDIQKEKEKTIIRNTNDRWAVE